MAKEQLIDTKLFRFVNEHDRSVLYRTKNRDNFSNNYFYYNLTSDDINRSLSEFNRVYGTVNSGIKVSLNTNDPYFKIYTDIRITKSYWNKVHNLVDLLKDEARALLIYINGKKIPDDIIKVYGTAGGTDIFIPYSHINLDLKNIEVFIEDTLFRDKEYIHTYTNYLTDVQIVIDLTGIDDFFEYNTFDKNKLLIYRNGYLDTTGYRASVNEKNKQISVTLSQDLLMSEIEIFYNHFISYRKSEVKTVQDTEFYYLIEKEYQSALRGVIPKRSCAFYRSGLRIPLSQVEQIFRNGFVVKNDTVLTAGSLELYIQDADLTNNRFYTSYDSDYYLQGMIGINRLLDGLKTGKSNSIFDEFPEIDYHKICNKNHTMYDDKLADDYIRKSVYDEAAYENYVVKTTELIERNPSLAREYIKAFGRSVTTYIVKNEGEDIFLGAKTVPKEGNELYFTIYLNWKHLENTKFEVTKSNNIYTIKIPNKYLKEGNNTIEVNENQRIINSNRVKFLSFDTQSIQKPDNKDSQGTLVVSKDVIESYTTDINHIVILQKVSNDERYLYPDFDNKRGYIAITDYEVDITETTYRFNFKTLPTNDFIVYFRNFSYSSKIEYDRDGSGDHDLRVFIHNGENDNPIPIIPLGMPEVYVDGDYYVYGLDYTFASCVDNDLMAGSVFSFTRRPPYGSIISYSFTGIDNKQIFETPRKFNYNSKYGLLYFSALEFPYSPDYLDLYIDSKKVFKTDIDILSDKLIRVRNIPVPFRDVYLETKFNVDYNTLDFIYKAYKEDEFEKVIKRLFRRLDPSDNTVDNTYTAPDDLYLDWEDDVGELLGPKEENPKNEDEVIDREDFMTSMYMKWLVSDDARSVMFNGEELSKKVFSYFQLYQIETTGNDIHIEGNTASMNSTTDYHMNCNLKNTSTSERMQVIIDTIKDENKSDIFYDDLWNIFKNSKASNLILPVDFPIDREKDGNYKGADSNIIYFKENSDVPLVIEPKKEIKKVKLNLSKNKEYAYINKDIIIFIDTDADELTYESTDNDELNIEIKNSDKYGKYLKVYGIKLGDYNIAIKGIKDGYESTTKIIDIHIINSLSISTPNTSLISIMRETTGVFEIETDAKQVILEKISGLDVVSIRKIKDFTYEITGMVVGNTAIIGKVYEDSGKFKYVQINIEVYEQPYTELEFDPTKATPFDDSYTTIKLITNADEDVYKINVYQAEPIPFFNEEDIYLEDNDNTIILDLYDVFKAEIESDSNLNYIEITKLEGKPHMHINEGDLELGVNDNEKLIILSTVDFNHIVVESEDEQVAEVVKKDENLVPYAEVKKRNGTEFDVIANTMCKGLVRVETKANLHLPIVKYLEFNTIMRLNTEISSTITKLEVDETYSKSIDITTNATMDQISTSYLPNDKEYIFVSKIENGLNVTGNEPGSIVLKISAQATDMRVRHIYIPITINGIDFTTLTSTIDNVSMFKDRTIEFEVETDADDIEYANLTYIDMNVEKLTKTDENSLNKYKFTITGTDYGNEILTISAISPKHKKSTIEIPVEIKEMPATLLDLETDSVHLKLNEVRNVIVTTDAASYTAESSDDTTVKAEIDTNNNNLILTALKSNKDTTQTDTEVYNYTIITVKAKVDEEHLETVKTITVSVDETE